jgi:hypothetical protein
MEMSLGTFGDLRLDKGGGAILEQMVARKTVCFRRLGGNRAGEERAGRFFASKKVTAPKIVEGWSDRTGAACAGRHVLAIDSLPRRRPGIRPRSSSRRRRSVGAASAR